MEVDRAVILAVPVLLGRGGPAAVHRPAIAEAFLAVAAGVIAAVFYSLQRVLRAGSFAKVGEEGREPVTPALTHEFAQSTVALVTDVLAAVASPLHLRPGLPFWRLPHAVLAVEAVTRVNFLAKAAAALRVAVVEQRRDDELNVAGFALALALPQSVGAFAASVFENVQPAIGSAG